MDHNGERVVNKGEKPYLFLENNPGMGVTFFLTDQKGVESRKAGKKFFGEIS